MQDRVPRYPGRVTLTPVSGQANTYDMVRADQPTQTGDAMNKANLLPDDVATALGLTQQNPQVKDALDKLSIQTQYVWRRRTGGFKQVINENDSYTLNYVNSSSARSVSYGTEYVISGNKLRLSGTVSSYNVSFNSALSNLPGILRGKYTTAGFNKVEDTKIYYIKSTSTFTNDGNYVMRVSGVQSITRVQVSYSEYEYLYSTNRNAYPEGVVGEYEYEFLGKPIENAMSGLKMMSGYYIGTGLVGQDNPNSITCDFVPKLIILFNFKGAVIQNRVYGSSSNPDAYSVTVGNCDGLTTDYVMAALFPSEIYTGSLTAGSYAKCSEDRKTIYWYLNHTSYSDAQFNSEGVMYRYLIIGI